MIVEHLRHAAVIGKSVMAGESVGLSKLRRGDVPRIKNKASSWGRVVRGRLDENRKPGVTPC
jgi:hypothetical protein